MTVLCGGHSGSDPDPGGGRRRASRGASARCERTATTRPTCSAIRPMMSAGDRVPRGRWPWTALALAPSPVEVSPVDPPAGGAATVMAAVRTLGLVPVAALPLITACGATAVPARDGDGRAGRAGCVGLADPEHLRRGVHRGGYRRVRLESRTGQAEGAACCRGALNGDGAVGVGGRLARQGDLGERDLRLGLGDAGGVGVVDALVVVLHVHDLDGGRQGRDRAVDGERGIWVKVGMLAPYFGPTPVAGMPPTL